MTTLAHAIYRPLKRMLPSAVARPIRAFVTAVLTPITFARDTGHFRSSLLSRAVDRHGEPLPWYTYPAIDFLRAKDLSALRVLEFGAGQSTLWWASRAAEVVALEEDADWHAEMIRRAPTNASVRLVERTAAAMAAAVEGERLFDVIVIDGLDRLEAAKLALGLHAEGGAVFLDNAGGHWGPVGTYPIIDLFRGAGFQRVDFYGYAPGVLLPHCTSLFFHGRCRLLAGDEPPVRFSAGPGK